nr:hypothetical protein [Alphaproteobacteria bacterium]
LLDCMQETRNGNEKRLVFQAAYALGDVRAGKVTLASIAAKEQNRRNERQKASQAKQAAAPQGGTGARGSSAAAPQGGTGARGSSVAAPQGGTGARGSSVAAPQEGDGQSAPLSPDRVRGNVGDSTHNQMVDNAQMARSAGEGRATSSAGGTPANDGQGVRSVMHDSLQSGSFTRATSTGSTTVENFWSKVTAINLACPVALLGSDGGQAVLSKMQDILLTKNEEAAPDSTERLQTKKSIVLFVTCSTEDSAGARIGSMSYLVGRVTQTSTAIRKLEALKQGLPAGFFLHTSSDTTIHGC